MNGNDFLRIADNAFTPFLRNLGFTMDTPSISGRLYQVEYTGPFHVVSVSYEPGDDAFFVMVFTVVNGQLSDIDDSLKTPRLADLNTRHMKTVTNEEHAANEEFFKSVVIQDKEEKYLLKAAKELRLVLPKHLRVSRETVSGLESE